MRDLSITPAQSGSVSAIVYNCSTTLQSTGEDVPENKRIRKTVQTHCRTSKREKLFYILHFIAALRTGDRPREELTRREQRQPRIQTCETSKEKPGRRKDADIPPVRAKIDRERRRPGIRALPHVRLRRMGTGNACSVSVPGAGADSSGRLKQELTSKAPPPERHAVLYPAQSGLTVPRRP